LKCSTVHYNKACGNGFKRDRCCGIIKACVGTNCRTFKGHCRLTGPEKRVGIKAGSTPPAQEVHDPNQYTDTKKHVKKSLLCHRVSGSLKKCACYRKNLKKQFRRFKVVEKKTKFMPYWVAKKFGAVRRCQKQFKTFTKFTPLFRKAPKRVQKRCVAEAKKITAKLQKLAPFLKHKKSFVHVVKRAEITEKTPKKKVSREEAKEEVKDVLKRFQKRFVHKQVKKPKTPVKKVKPLKRVACDLYADPHAKSFDGKLFEAQTVGDWVLYSGPKLKVSYRGKSFGRWVGVIGWIVDVSGDIVKGSLAGGVVVITVNGEAVKLAPGTPLKLGNGGSLTQLGSKFNINSNDGEDCDFISYGTFFNAYVRSDKPEVTGLCSHQFITSTAFGHPRDGTILPTPKLNCAKKEKHLTYCKEHRGLKGRAALNCAFDLCAKMPKEIEKKMIEQNKVEDKSRTYVVSPIKRVTCDLYADPHARSFDGARFEAQTAGDWVLHSGPSLSVHYRGQSFGRWIGIVKYLIEVRGDIVRSEGFNGVTVNGNLVQLVAGQAFSLPNGGKIVKAGNKVTVSSGVGEECDFISFGTFFNAYVRSTLAGVSGLCSHQFVRSHAFGHPQEGKMMENPKLHCEEKERHMKYCRGKGLHGHAQLNCAFDLCAKFPRSIERKILRGNAREGKIHPEKEHTRSPFLDRRDVKPPPLIREDLFKTFKRRLGRF